MSWDSPAKWLLVYSPPGQSRQGLVFTDFQWETFHWDEEGIVVNSHWPAAGSAANAARSLSSRATVVGLKPNSLASDVPPDMTFKPSTVPGVFVSERGERPNDPRDLTTTRNP
jgi:hypothetical protein